MLLSQKKFPCVSDGLYNVLKAVFRRPFTSTHQIPSQIPGVSSNLQTLPWFWHTTKSQSLSNEENRAAAEEKARGGCSWHKQTPAPHSVPLE